MMQLMNAENFVVDMRLCLLWHTITSYCQQHFAEGIWSTEQHYSPSRITNVPACLESLTELRSGVLPLAVTVSRALCLSGFIYGGSDTPAANCC
ncbi:hypothetical protein V2J09_004224 [Rumex salicifolius]